MANERELSRKGDLSDQNVHKLGRIHNTHFSIHHIKTDIVFYSIYDVMFPPVTQICGLAQTGPFPSDTLEALIRHLIR